MNFNERKEKFLSEYNALPSDMERFDYIINKTVCLYGNQKYFENFKIYIVSCNRVCYNLNCNIVFGGKQYGALL